MNLRITAIITTFNRCSLMQRAVHSVLSQSIPASEIIIVDDASTDGTSAFARKAFPFATVIALKTNGGPSVARNVGLYRARSQFVLYLDDDDVLLPDALETISRSIAGLENYESYPVFQFAHSNGRVPRAFQCITLRDFCTGTIQGDFLPVIQRDGFLQYGFAYPSIRCGGEHLLWWEVADQCGIPTWQHVVSRVGDDAPIRLTSTSTQLARPAEYADLQELTIQLFGDRLRATHLATLIKKHVGAGAYWLLAGNRKAAASHVRPLLLLGYPQQALLLFVMMLCPQTLLRHLFRRFRANRGTVGPLHRANPHTRDSSAA